MNKKVVYIVILVECILAVFLISFFGNAIFQAIVNVPVQEVYFTYEDGTKIEDGKALKFELKGSQNEYQLYWMVGPEDATDDSVKFTSSKPEFAEVDEFGRVSFYERTGDVVITVTSADGSNVTDTIHIVLQNSAGGDVDDI